MLERFISLQEAIRATVPNLNVELPILPLEEWKCLEQICEVLKPFYEVTTIMSAEKYLTASKAMVMTQGLLAIYDNYLKKDFYEVVKDLVTRLRSGIVTRFYDIETNSVIGLCTLLDPRFKEHAFKDRDALALVKCLVIEKVAENLDDDIQEAESVGVNDSMSIWLEFDRKVNYVQTPKSADAKAIEEVEMYLKEKIVPRTACPMQWWRDHKFIYPALYSLFIRSCNIVLTPVPCERAFSRAGYIISDRRTRLTSSKVTKIMFLNN
ncbi:unnamed protein product [Plutella xylostella]|uniref:(diamondback moth) hypothetical protein n=1 Tax=Plutella xylostella TaxID=51655 RepID=A0A8S4FU04_PLUXY|nr:unnamed protein product [Plutella xylostella]